MRLFIDLLIGIPKSFAATLLAAHRAFRTSVLVLRRKAARFFLALLPVVCQAGVLLLISFAPAYRYHYGTVLAGIFLLGFFFIPMVNPDK